MTLTKADLVEIIYERVGVSKKEAIDLVELVFRTIKDELCRGKGVVKISGFGKFQVRSKRARRGRNPQTGEAMTISARRVLTFSPSRILRDAINGKAPLPPSVKAELERSSSKASGPGGLL